MIDVRPVLGEADGVNTPFVNHSTRLVDTRRALELGAATGLVAAIADVAWTSLGRFAVSFEWVLAVFGLVVPVAALGGAALAVYSGLVERAFPAARGWRARLAANTLVAMPFMAFALWVPASWIEVAWNNLPFNGRALVVAALAATASFVLIACGLVRALARRHAEGRLPATLRGALAVSSALVAAMTYWSDGWFFEGDYEDFHYGMNGVFVAATALALGTLRSLLPELTATRLARPGTRRAVLVVLVAALVLVAWSPFGAIERAEALTFDKLVGTARALTDVDGDGHSSLFGGGDCRAFDGEVSPGEQEIPGNGRDEDCSGKDAAWPRPPQPSKKAQGAATSPEQGGKPGKPWNVVLILVDALRADHLGLYGYSRPTSPTLDRLGRESLVFDQAYAQGTKTSESVPSIMTGSYPSNVPRRYGSVRHPNYWSYRLAERALPLAVLMKRAGYATGAGVSFRLLSTIGLDRGFDKFQRNDPDRSAAQFLSAAKPPFFYFAHFRWPHAPYEKHRERDFGDSDLDRYDGEVLTADDSVRKVLDTLRARKLLETTVVIVTADHGEEFRDHGGQFHRRKLYRELVHVPLLVKIPGLPARRIVEPVELVDLVPTLAELVGFELNPGAQDGQSLLAWPRADGVGGAYAEDVDGMQRVVARAYFDGRYRLVDDLRRGRRELFDHQNDRAELHDIEDMRPDIARRLAEVMSVRSLRRHTRTFELLRPEADSDTWRRLLPTLERDEMIDLAFERLPPKPTKVQRKFLKGLLARTDLEPATTSKATELLGRAPNRREATQPSSTPAPVPPRR